MELKGLEPFNPLKTFKTIMFDFQVTKKDLEAVESIRRKFFGPNHETSIPSFEEQNLRSLEQIFSAAVFQAPLCRDLDLMVNIDHITVRLGLVRFF